MRKNVAFILILGCLSTSTGEALQEPPRVEQSKIDAAIKKGIEWLTSHTADHLNTFEHGSKWKMQYCELVLWTYLHAYPDISPSHPAFQALFDDMLKRPLELTYCVALQAMVLEEHQRVDYQGRIRQCAQFLVDNQCANGQWSYGERSLLADEPTPKTMASGRRKGPNVRKFADFSVRPPKPDVKTRVKVEKSKSAGPTGDNSNTQYAALGMRACYDAGILIPPAVTDKAIDWYRKSQKAPEGPALKLELKEPDMPHIKGKSAVSETYTAEPRGWCYVEHSDHAAYGSMTAGSTGGLAIWLYIQDDDWKKDPRKFKRSWRRDRNVLDGLAWMAKNFSVTYNPGPLEFGHEMNSQKQLHYYLYAMERLGMLYGTEWMGSHNWYAEGAKALVESQQPDDGSWWKRTEETCFAILFLKRATLPLTPTEAVKR